VLLVVDAPAAVAGGDDGGGVLEVAAPVGAGGGDDGRVAAALTRTDPDAALLLERPNRSRTPATSTNAHNATSKLSHRG
jgi:hypothetical protein